ncbi:hypothetical protein [Bordetella phage CN2]|uniref:Uncharacterized protein n=1 Tax=Bordetella phage CN2 TaxID=1916124 RepID=A0A2D0W9F8_9CAUD|nr:hypothetical protein HOS30_gp45 [Bordetella phage CN2]APL99263.1 hypothetical protein [Bordetella phage CN2]
MKRVIRFQTADGALHETASAARGHADRRYGDALTRLAHRAVQQEKYTKICDFIDKNLDAFEELKALKVDIDLENDDGEE